MGFECYRIGDLVLDAGKQEVTRNGSPVPVPRLSLKLLLSLVRHAPNVVSVQTLEQEVWSGLIVDKGTINKRVLLLRKALGENEGMGPYVTVIRGSGYRLNIPVERIESEPEKTAPQENESQTWYQRSSGAIRTISYWLLGIVAVLALYQGIQDKSPGRSASGEGIEQTGRTQPTVIYDQRFIAVMPFVDLSDGQVHQYLGDGIAEEVINLLADMEGLDVAARTSSFSFRGTSLNAMDIADDLRVGTILEGSLRHDGNQIRVTAQLIDTRNGFHIWSKTYDRKFDQVFEVQDDIALSIARALQLTLTDSSMPDSSKQTTDNIEAFSMYLKGRELFNERIRLRAEGLREALGFFWKAVELDPKFARAHAGIASVYWLLTTYDSNLDQDTYFQQAAESANFALEIDPVSVDALGALASIHAARGEIEMAVARFEQIRSIGSSDSNIIHWQAMLHMRLGYFDELIGELTDTYRHDPLNEHIGWSLAAAYNFAGQPEEAEKILLKLENFKYRDYNLGLAAINEGDYPKARKYLRDVQLRSGVLPAAYADIVIDVFENPQSRQECENMIISAASQGELDELVAFEALLILGSPRALELDIDPYKVYKLQILSQVWNNWGVELRQDARFKEWVEKLNYVGFWRKYGWPDRCRPTGPDSFECI